MSKKKTSLPQPPILVKYATPSILGGQQLLSFPLKTPNIPLPATAPTKQCRISCQITKLLDLPRAPFQQANNSRGIMHWTPNKLKIKHHNSVATGQYRSRWSIDSPLHLHMQHQSITKTLLFLRLSMVRLLPIAAHQTKKGTLGGTFSF